MGFICLGALEAPAIEKELSDSFFISLQAMIELTLDNLVSDEE